MVASGFFNLTLLSQADEVDFAAMKQISDIDPYTRNDRSQMRASLLQISTGWISWPPGMSVGLHSRPGDLTKSVRWPRTLAISSSPTSLFSHLHPNYLK